MRPEELSDLQLDAIRELGSVGVGHAATALSQILGHFVGISVPEARIVAVSDVPSMYGGAETLVAAVYTRILGDIEGGILFMMPRDAVLGLVDLLRSRPPGSTKTLGNEEEAIAVHAATLLISAYVAAMGRMADVNVLPSSPAFAYDMMGAVLEVVTSEIGMKADTAILVTARFMEEDAAVDAALFYLPDPDSLDVVLGKMGVA
ncbi:MAG: chemotaxis protein CheC [Coriobacteriales bacterium]|nr:chemotaxis protein CheC [Actinomycetes bacterium]